MKLIKELFSEKINYTILMRTLREHRALCVFLAVTLILTVTCFAVQVHLQNQPPRYQLDTAGSEINFENTQVKTHTAADGIAVVCGINALVKTPTQAVEQTPQPSDTQTHSNFTLPVQMDDTSIGVLNIPDIDLSVRVYESDDAMEDMNKGAAHFKNTSAWQGNIGLSAHNINLDGTDGYFLNLYTLKKGAIISYNTALGNREYTVEKLVEIAESDWSYLGRTDDNRITLITCISGKPTKRLCVVATENK